MHLLNVVKMDETITYLENHAKIISSAEEAIDFNFNESSDVDSEGNDNMVVPFTHFFKRRLIDKDLLLIEGYILKDARSFRVDFCTNKDDIAFHINPRLDQKIIVRNSFIKSKWGEEERHAVKRYPMERGMYFEIQIFIHDKEYMISINGEHASRFQHRIPLYEVTRIEISGDISLQNVSLFKSTAYPVSCRKKFSCSANDLVVPVTRYMKYGLCSFGKIMIKGKVKLLPFSFYINVQSTNKVYPHPKVIYHFNARYGTSCCVVENSWGVQDEAWDEEVVSPLPKALYPGNVFTLDIVTNNSHIQTKGTDWELAPFYHRMNPENGYYLHIEGDIILSSIKIFPDYSVLIG